MSNLDIPTLLRRITELEAIPAVADALARKEADAAVSRSVTVQTAIQVARLEMEPSAWSGAEHAAFNKLVALAQGGTSFDYDQATNRLTFHNPVRAIDRAHIQSLQVYAPALAVIFDALPASVVSGIARALGMPTVPAGVKHALRHLISAPFARELIKSWSMEQLFGVSPTPDSPRSLAEHLGDRHWLVGWHRTDDRRIIRNTVVLRDKITGQETTWKVSAPSSFAQHKICWRLSDVTLDLSPLDTALPALANGPGPEPAPLALAPLAEDDYPSPPDTHRGTLADDPHGRNLRASDGPATP